MYDPTQQVHFFNNLITSTMKWMQTKDVSQWGSIHCREDWSSEYPEVKQPVDDQDPVTSDDSDDPNNEPLEETHPPVVDPPVEPTVPSVVLHADPTVLSVDSKLNEDSSECTTPRTFLRRRESKLVHLKVTTKKLQAPTTTPDNSCSSEPEDDDVESDFNPEDHSPDTDEDTQIENFTEISQKNVSYTPKTSRKRRVPERGPFVQ